MKDVADQAAEWFLRVRGAGADSATYTDWLKWVEADPAHKAAFARIQQAWTLVGEAQPAWPGHHGLEAANKQTDRRWRRLVPVGLAAAVVAAVVLAMFVRPGMLVSLSTERGEQQSATLSDGSRLRLGGATRVEVKFTPDRRLVRAQEGEVFYTVEPDPARPFVVQSGPVTVTAIGTAFSVRREGGAVSVVVAEGLVEVKAAGPDGKSVRVKAGQRVRFDRGHLAGAAETLEAQAGAEWARGRLQFEKEPLRIVVASLNRYSAKEILLTDPQLGELEFTGTVFEQGIGDWLSAIQRLFPVRVEEDTDRFVILPAR